MQKHKYYRVRVMVFSTTFNNSSAISWGSVLLVEETGVTEEKHWPVASHWQTLSHNVSSIPCLSGSQTHNFSGGRQWYFQQWFNSYLIAAKIEKNLIGPSLWKNTSTLHIKSLSG